MKNKITILVCLLTMLYVGSILATTSAQPITVSTPPDFVLEKVFGNIIDGTNESLKNTTDDFVIENDVPVIALELSITNPKGKQIDVNVLFNTNKLQENATVAVFHVVNKSVPFNERALENAKFLSGGKKPVDICLAMYKIVKPAPTPEVIPELPEKTDRIMMVYTPSEPVTSPTNITVSITYIQFTYSTPLIYTNPTIDNRGVILYNSLTIISIISSILTIVYTTYSFLKDKNKELKMRKRKFIIQ